MDMDRESAKRTFQLHLRRNVFWRSGQAGLSNRRRPVVECGVGFASLCTGVGEKKINFREHQRKSDYAAARTEFGIGPLHTRPFVMGRAVLQQDFVVMRNGEIRRSEA